MALGRILFGVLAGPALLVGEAAPLIAAPKEPLIVTQMPDPDPYFVALGPDAARAKTGLTADGPENSRIDEAMQSFGRIVGEAAMIEQKQTEAKCREGEAESATLQQRFAWAARCRYSRH